MSWAHTAAVKATVATVPILASRTFVSFVPDALTPLEPPYCLIHPSDGVPEEDRFTGPARVENPEFTLHIVGVTAEQVQVITGKVKAKFVVGGFLIPPAVSGTSGRAGYWRSPIPIQADDAVPPSMLWQVVELGWQSVPA